MATANWFYKKSPEAQKAYIAAHPNSIYAKAAPRGGKFAKVSHNDSIKARRAARDARQNAKPDPAAKAAYKTAERTFKAAKVAYEGVHKKMDKLRAQRDRKSNPISSAEFTKGYRALQAEARKLGKAVDTARITMRKAAAKRG
eukprot:TRINITY_DN12554_c0_g1_i1.p2 TRINITY_DN12554_c0_g1~~TRINITY_DN12554_c0_g1_i1.p2  ORF type:complete len:143 (-),score=20.34 TRINITY_DN12554_c0_g1_i1:29-457(-)